MIVVAGIVAVILVLVQGVVVLWLLRFARSFGAYTTSQIATMQALNASNLAILQELQRISPQKENAA